MKRFLLLRHAKSEWNDPALPDFERPLAERGVKDAPRIGRFLASLKKKPDLVISSPAERARQTAEIVAESMAYRRNEIMWDRTLYEGTHESILRALDNLSDDVQMPLIIGHNPMLELVTAELLFGGEMPIAAPGVVRIPTAGLLCFDLDVSHWNDVKTGKGMLRWMLIPKILKPIA